MVVVSSCEGFHSMLRACFRTVSELWSLSYCQGTESPCLSGDVVELRMGASV